LQSTQSEFAARNTEILAISIDPPEDSAKIVTKLGLSFPILSDPEFQAIDAFGVRHQEGMMGKDIARPAVFILNTQGRLTWSNLTDNWRVRVTPNELIEALDSMK